MESESPRPEAPGETSLDALDFSTCLHIFYFLKPAEVRPPPVDPAVQGTGSLRRGLHQLGFSAVRCALQVAAVAGTCKLFRDLSRQPVLWKRFYEELSPAVQKLVGTPTGQVQDWRAAVVRGLDLQSLRLGVWERLTPADHVSRRCITGTACASCL